MIIPNITFTGIDETTKKSDLLALSHDYPTIEFGLLHSLNWDEKSNRYPNPKIMESLCDERINYSLHLCGRLARRALVNDYSELYASMGHTLDYFKRMQLNIGRIKPKPNYHISYPSNMITQIIIQTSDMANIELYEQLSKNINCAPLFDASGGRGLYTPVSQSIVTYDSKYIGFAGGISIDNCIDVMNTLTSHHNTDTTYWIDMETSLRDKSDNFSIQRCTEVCQKLFN